MNEEFEQPEHPDTPAAPVAPPQEKRYGYLLIAFLLGAILPVIVCFLVIVPARVSVAQMRVQAEAVKAGHAIYKVVDEFGKTEFQWLPVEKK